MIIFASANSCLSAALKKIAPIVDVCFLAEPCNSSPRDHRGWEPRTQARQDLCEVEGWGKKKLSAGFICTMRGANEQSCGNSRESVEMSRCVSRFEKWHLIFRCQFCCASAPSEIDLTPLIVTLVVSVWGFTVSDCEALFSVRRPSLWLSSKSS